MRLIVSTLILGWVVVACLGGSDADPPDQVTHTPTINSPQPTATLAPVTATATRDVSARATPSPTLAPASTPTAPEDVAPPPTVTPPGAAPAAQTPPATTVEGGPVIVLNPAHDHTAPGALGIEYQLVLTTALHTQAALEEAGYTVHLTRYNNDTVLHEDPTLVPPNGDDFHPGYSRAYAYASKALEYDPDLVIVLHYNAFDDPAASGLEVYYCELGGAQNLVLAEIVLEELLAAFQVLGYEPPQARVIEDIAVARGNRHFPSLGNVYDYPRIHLENRYAGVPVVLTEPLYLTNATERALLDDPGSHIAFAQAYVRAVDRWFGR